MGSQPQPMMGASLLPEGMESSDGGLAAATTTPTRSTTPQSKLALSGSFKDVVLNKEAMSEQVPSGKKRRRMKLNMKRMKLGKDDWRTLWKFFKEWISNPLNAAMVFWCVLAAPATILLCLLETNLLNGIKPLNKKNVRDQWVEVCSQILNSLFFLMVLVIHPAIFRQSIQLYRWRPADIVSLRKDFCKDGKRKPNEWIHILIININLHITCFATYGLAIVYWAVPMKKRTGWEVPLTVLDVLAWGAPVIAALYAVFSPLGRASKGEDNTVEEVAIDGKVEVVVEEADQEWLDHHRAVEYPPWDGSVVPGCCNSPRVAWLVCFFPWCIFGWNMERLGFGSRLVQTVTFMLIMFGPLIVFELSAHSFKYKLLEYSLVYWGVGLCVLGLLYGAIWRRKMQQQYTLPINRSICWNATITDSMLWLCCPLCSLCQEVRTAERYEVLNGKFYEPVSDIPMESLPAEGPMEAPTMTDWDNRV